MARTDRIRPGRQHRNIVEEAGISRISLLAIVAGTLTAYGAFALLAAVVGAVLEAADVETNLNFETNDWTGATAGSALATAVTLFLAYLFGGYVAGRLARRSGLLHGLGVFLLGVVAAAVIGGVVSALTDNDDLNRNLRNVGIPNTADEWGNVGIAAGVLALVLMAAGAILGGMLGERWHTKLARRAADPDYGPEADARRRADQADHERDERVRADTAIRRDVEGQRPVGSRGMDTTPDLDDRDRDRFGRDDRPYDDDRDRIVTDRPDRTVVAGPGNDPMMGADTGADEPRYTASEWAEMQQRNRPGDGRP